MEVNLPLVNLFTLAAQSSCSFEICNRKKNEGGLLKKAAENVGRAISHRRKTFAIYCLDNSGKCRVVR